MRWLLSLLLAVEFCGASTYLVAAGVEQYDDPGIVSLKYAVADVSSLVEAFEARGVPAGNITLLSSAANDFAIRPTRSNVLAALQKVRRRAVAGDTVVFIFSGHGMEVDDQAYLLTVDSSRELLTDTALPLSLVHEALRGLQAENLLFVVDACRNDPTSSKAVADAEFAEPFAKGLRPKVAEEGTGHAKNVAVLTACDVGQRAWELPDEGHGVFTYYLLKALAGEAPANADGTLKVGAVARYLDEQLKAWGERARREQTPRLDFSEGEDFPLVTVPVRNPEPTPTPKPEAKPAAKLIVESSPAGAEVFLEERRLGVTPLTIDIPAEEALAAKGVILKLEGYYDGRWPVRLVPGQETKLDGLVLAKPKPETPKPEAPKPPVGDLGQRPAGWPERLNDYQLPAGRTWHDYRIRQQDGMPQVRIPAGEFTMGDPELSISQHKETVGEFWIDVHEVTISQYGRYLRPKREAFPLQILNMDPKFMEKNPDLPMFFVDYEMASSYAAWAGGRLPTAIEWERAARGGVEGTVFPWGDQWDPDQANGAGELLEPVGSYAPNAFGLVDMIGNIAEWCRGDDGASLVRGGSFTSGEASLKLSVILEQQAKRANRITGFRCVSDK